MDAAVDSRRQAFALSAADAGILRADLRRLAALEADSARWKRLREQLLREAVAAGKVPLFDALLQDRPGAPAADHNGKTALMYAAEAGNLDVLAQLVPLKGDGKKPPHYAWTYRYGAPEERIAYLNRCDEVTDTTFGYTALMHAAGAGKADAAAYLLNAGADPDVRCGFAQFSAAQLAQMGGHGDIVALIEQKKADWPWWVQMWDSLDFRSSVFWWVLGLASAFALALWRFIVLFRRKWRESAPAGPGA